MSPPDRQFVEKAYRLLRKPDWSELEASLDDPIRGRLINGYAARLQRQALSPQRQEQGIKPPARAFPTHPTPLRFDRKRLAAGEREDDD